MRASVLFGMILAGVLSACATPPGPDASGPKAPVSDEQTRETRIDPAVAPFEPVRIEELEPAEPAPEERVLRADAESGRTYLYFGPEDFKGEQKKYLSLSDTQSAEWLQRTLYRYLNLDRNRVRVTARPGHAEVGISGAITEAGLDEIVEEILKLRERHEALQPIKVICRVADEEEIGAFEDAGHAEPALAPVKEPAPRPTREPGLFPTPKEVPAGGGVQPAFPL